MIWDSVFSDTILIAAFLEIVSMKIHSLLNLLLILPMFKINILIPELNINNNNISELEQNRCAHNMEKVLSLYHNSLFSHYQND